MEIKTVKVSDKGQIAIPQTIREEMKIERGDELILLQTNGKILIQKAESISEEIHDDFKDLIKFSENSLKSVWDNKEDDIWNSYIKKR